MSSYTHLSRRARNARPRWVRYVAKSAYIDTWGEYAMVADLEMCPFWGMVVHPLIADRIVTHIARRRALGARPWKVAR